MGFSFEISVSALTVFFQGILNFFSPCVLPLIPLYMSYLAGGTKIVESDGTIRYPRKKILLNTMFFVLGVSFVFFLLGFGFTALGQFFSSNRLWFARISGIVMILFGLYQFGAFGYSKTLGSEHKLPFNLNRWAMGPLPAFLLGFTFSFAWTPCIGPTLGSVLLMAGSSASSGKAFILIGVYTIGFIIPFLTVGFFTGTVLDFFKKHQNVVRYTVKAGAVLLILMGLMTLTGFMNGFANSSSNLNENDINSTSQQQSSEGNKQPSNESALVPNENEQAANGDAQPSNENALVPNGNEQAANGGAPSSNKSVLGSNQSEQAANGNEQAANAGTQPSNESVQPSNENVQSPSENVQSPSTNVQPPNTTVQPPNTTVQPPKKEESSSPKNPAPDFTLVDQFGNKHKLSDYRGKTVFLNFWATWCPPCRAEMPEIQALYERYGKNSGDLIVLGVAAPNMGSEGNRDSIVKFLSDNGYNFPVVMDEGGSIFSKYRISSFPTTFMIDKDGNIVGSVKSSLTGDMMESMVKQAMAGK